MGILNFDWVKYKNTLIFENYIMIVLIQQP